MKNKRAMIIAIAVVVVMVALVAVVAVMLLGQSSQQKPADVPVVEASEVGQSSTSGELPIVSDSPEETSSVTVGPSSNSEPATPGASGGAATDESTASADSSGKSDENPNANAGSNPNGSSGTPSGSDASGGGDAPSSSDTPSEGKLSPHETPILEL